MASSPPNPSRPTLSKDSRAHDNPSINNNSRAGLSQFSRNVLQLVHNVGKCSQKTDSKAHMIRLSKEAQVVEMVAAIRNVLGLEESSSATLPCYIIPYRLNLRFFGRDDELRTVSKALCPATNGTTRLRAVGIHGLVGAGKTQLALQYANTSMETYEVIAWIPAETQIKLVQGLCSLANKLGLTEGTHEDDNQGVQKVRDWLNTAKKPFLLVFDNVDKAELLDQIWPSSGKGSIIITTRSPSTASRRAATTVSLGCFSDEVSEGVLRSLTGKEPADDADRDAMGHVCRLVGGLPLAMAQISDFIRDRDYSYGEVSRVYEKSAEKVFARSEQPVEYDHTVLTTWDISLQKLAPEARRLQHLLAFFDPDSIPERFLNNPKAGIEAPELGFLTDEFDFGDAIAELSRSSLVSRLSNFKALSLHRLVQLAAFRRIPEPDRVSNFDNAVQLLYYGFPNTWQNRGPHQGHGFASWATCSEVLPHVSWLMRLSEKHAIKSAKPDMWAELVFRAGTYLWETQNVSAARSFIEFGLGIGDMLSTSIAAQAYRLLGHIALDIPEPWAALAAYKQALTLRETIEVPESPPIADICNSIACTYAELGNVEQAMSFLDRSVAIHNAHDPSAMSRTRAILAVTHLRAGRPEEALEAIGECWRLQGMTQAQIEQSKYPKHSGDIMLLARAFWMQNKQAEAQEASWRLRRERRAAGGEFAIYGGPDATGKGRAGSGGGATTRGHQPMWRLSRNARPRGPGSLVPGGCRRRDRRG